MTEKNLLIYLQSTKKKLHKIIILYEKFPDTLKTYIDSLKLDLIGSLNVFNYLNEDGNFISIINILQYLYDNDFDHAVCKREVFKSINTIKIILRKLSSMNGEDSD